MDPKFPKPSRKDRLATKRAERRERASRVAALRVAAIDRSEGFCENPDCGEPLYRAGCEMDHYYGGALRRLTETLDGAWMLCCKCHTEKTANHPSIAAWNDRWARFCEIHGYEVDGRLERFNPVAPPRDASNGRFTVEAAPLDWFWDRVSPEPNSGCWLWTGDYTSFHGYGLVSRKVDGRRVREAASRTAWRLFKGEIPQGLLVLHRCDVPACVNAPGGHLFLGTQSDNIKDAYAKGRAHSPFSKRSAP